MTRAFRAIFVVVLMILGVAAAMAADTLEDAAAAYRKANYATALRIYRSMADQGLAIEQA
jgi:ABC-type phosphate transport system permease subunit